MLPVFIALLIAFPVAADTLLDLKNAVSSLRGTTAIRGSVELHRVDNSAGRFSNEHFEGTATLRIAMDGDGVHVDFPRSLVDRFAAEQRVFVANPKKTPAISRTAGAVTPLWVLENLNASERFLAQLQVSTLKSESRVLFQNRPVRLLQLDVKEFVPEGVISIGSVSYPMNRLKVWIADDNLPVAVEHEVERDGKFMFIHAREHELETWMFARVGDHLVVTRHTAKGNASGLGQSGGSETSETITISSPSS